MGKTSVKNPFKTMYKGTASKKKDGMHRPEGAGNFDNMDDYNFVKTVNVQVVNASDYVSGSYLYGDGSNITGLTGVADNLGNHIATQTVSGAAVSMSGEVSGASFRGDGDNLDIPLNTIENPEASKVFNFGNNKYLTFTSVDRTPIADEGIFNFETSGNFTGDLLHIHQHTGNAGADTVLCRIEGIDSDACPLHISGAHPYSISANKDMITSANVSGANIAVMSGAIVTNVADITSLSGAHSSLSGAYDVTDADLLSLSGAHNSLSGAFDSGYSELNTVSGAYYTHAADSSDPHGATLTQTTGSFTDISRTGDYETMSGAYIANMIFGTGATPSGAAIYPRGSIYVQYTP